MRTAGYFLCILFTSSSLAEESSRKLALGLYPLPLCRELVSQRADRPAPLSVLASLVNRAKRIVAAAVPPKVLPESVVSAFLSPDPYIRSGVAGWDVRVWGRFDGVRMEHSDAVFWKSLKNRSPDSEELI